MVNQKARQYIYWGINKGLVLEHLTRDSSEKSEKGKLKLCGATRKWHIDLDCISKFLLWLNLIYFNILNLTYFNYIHMAHSQKGTKN